MHPLIGDPVPEIDRVLHRASVDRQDGVPRADISKQGRTGVYIEYAHNDFPPYKWPQASDPTPSNSINRQYTTWSDVAIPLILSLRGRRHPELVEGSGDRSNLASLTPLR